MSIIPSEDRTEEFDSSRKFVLEDAYGNDICSDEVKDYLSNLPAECFSSALYKQQHNFPYLQPRGGFATFEMQKKLTDAFCESGSDFIPLTIDSHTRHNDYETAEVLLKKSELETGNFLNGYPLINHGYEVTRELYRSVHKPVSLRHGTPDARLLSEIALASGITEIEGGGISYCIPYSKDFPLARALLYWQYVDRLCAFYSTPERPIQRESFGCLTATMVPPCIVIAIELIEMLLAAQEGVQSFAVSFGQTGSIVQDAALASVMRQKTKKYLDKFNLHSVQTQLVYHQWMGAFPMDTSKAEQIISISAFIANVIHADKIVVKTKKEAFGIPDIQANCQALQQVRFIFDKFPFAGELRNELIDEEISLLSEEVDSIMNYIFSMGETDLKASVLNAFSKGIIDVPFAPHLQNQNKLIAERDKNLSIRIRDKGNVPIGEKNFKAEQDLMRRNRPAQKMDFIDKILNDINIMV